MNIEITFDQIKNIFYLVLLILLFIKLICSKNKNTKSIDRNTIDQCLDYLQKKIKQPKPQYEPNYKIMKEFEEDPFNQTTLYRLAKDIIQHCGYKPAALYVKVVEYNPNENISGQYTILGNASTIEIRLLPNIQKDEILAILIHECMHFYLRCKGVGITSDKLFNEYLTDIATIYMGFYKYMHKGYSRVGYLSTSELKYIYKRIYK